MSKKIMNGKTIKALYEQLKASEDGKSVKCEPCELEDDCKVQLTTGMESYLFATVKSRLMQDIVIALIPLILGMLEMSFKLMTEEDVSFTLQYGVIAFMWIGVFLFLMIVYFYEQNKRFKAQYILHYFGKDKEI